MIINGAFASTPWGRIRPRYIGIVGSNGAARALFLAAGRLVRSPRPVGVYLLGAALFSIPGPWRS